MSRTFDPKCLELVEYFTDDEPAGKWTQEDKNELASLVQSTIENFMADSDFLLDDDEVVRIIEKEK